MEAQLIFSYDRIGDILFIGRYCPYREQNSDDIEDMVIARFNPDTDEVESFEVLFVSRRITSHDPFQLDITVEPGAINDQPVPPEFDRLVQSGSKWLTVPKAAVVGMELDVKPPKFPTYPGNRPADISRFELTLDTATPLAGYQRKLYRAVGIA